MPGKNRLKPRNGNGGSNGHSDAVAPSDTLLGFTLPGRDARGRVVKLGPTLTAIHAAHDYNEAQSRLLGEALALTAMLGAMLRGDGGELTFQAQSQGGIVDLLVCDYRAGALRGYLRADPDASFAPDATLADIFGTGYLAITLDQAASEERYQGVVPLEGQSLSDACAHYFMQSEQIPTLIRAAVAPIDGGGWAAGGFLVQHLPRAEVGAARLSLTADNPDWQHVRILSETLSDAELVDPELSPETLLWRLFNEDEVRVIPPVGLTRGCRCSPAHISAVLGRFPDDEIEAMRAPDGRILVDCAFCARTFPIEL